MTKIRRIKFEKFVETFIIEKNFANDSSIFNRSTSKQHDRSTNNRSTFKRRSRVNSKKKFQTKKNDLF